MDFQAASARVPLVAPRKGADEWLQPCVRELVRLEMPLRYKLLLTLIASKWTLARVRAHVCLEVSSLCKLLEADGEGTEKQFDFVLGALDALDLCAGIPGQLIVEKVLCTYPVFESRHFPRPQCPPR